MVEKNAKVDVIEASDLLDDDAVKTAILEEERSRAALAKLQEIPISTKPTGYIMAKSDVHFLPQGAPDNARKKVLTANVVFETRMFNSRDIARLIVAGLVEYVEHTPPRS
jgi:hypothetical protein